LADMPGIDNQCPHSTMRRACLLLETPFDAG
jgi:hypothetical protein